MSNAEEINERECPLLWDRIIGLIEQDVAERQCSKLFVEVPGEESGWYEKEIGELSIPERQSLHPILREAVVERLLDRYLAEQGHVDLADKRRACTKKIEDLTPEDLPALIKADQLRAEECQKERERAMFAWEVRADLDRLGVVELDEMRKAGKKEVRR